MVLDGEECPGELLPGDLLPVLRRPRLLERDQLMKRPDVAAVRDAWNLDQLEAHVSSQAEKGKVKNVTGRRHRTKSGETVRLEYHGPDRVTPKRRRGARGPGPRGRRSVAEASSAA